jgi:hypothetical protein
MPTGLCRHSLAKQHDSWKTLIYIKERKPDKIIFTAPLAQRYFAKNKKKLKQINLLLKCKTINHK